jgi:hypothetical protein
METFMIVIGGIILACLSIAVSCAAIAWLMSEYRERKWWRFNRQKENFCRIIGSDIAKVHHWFSEDVEVFEAFSILAKGMLEDGEVFRDICRMRDQWRNNVIAAKAEREKRFPTNASAS